MVVARDYAGTLIVATVTAALLLAGLVHRGTVLAHQRAMNDAIARAQAWIGYRAPAEFRRDVERVSVVTIEPGAIYRACVPSIARPRTYCVIVKPSSVAFAGYEPNSTFAQGVK